MELKPVIPFEPVRAEKTPTGANWVAQVKWDGVRILTYYDGQAVHLFNRRLNERTMQFPELLEINSYCQAASVILDGELIALENGQPSFQRVMRRDSIRQADKVAPAMRATPVVYIIFDILFHNGLWVTSRTLKERQKLLADLVKPDDRRQLAENFPDADMLFEVVKARGMEGIVCKDLTSTYAVRGKDKRWQKLKNYQDLVAVIGGVTMRGSVVNALLLGLYDKEGRLWYIGHAGTGRLTDLEWRGLTETIRPLATPLRPFVNKPERMKDAVWLTPSLTAKVKYIEWTHGHTLRQPSIQAIVDIPAGECVFSP